MMPCHGSDTLCSDPMLYGLIFDRVANVMVFKPLCEIGTNQAERKVLRAGQSTGLIEDDPNIGLEMEDRPGF